MNGSNCTDFVLENDLPSSSNGRTGQAPMLSGMALFDYYTRNIFKRIMDVACFEVFESIGLRLIDVFTIIILGFVIQILNEAKNEDNSWLYHVKIHCASKLPFLLICFLSYIIMLKQLVVGFKTDLPIPIDFYWLLIFYLYLLKSLGVFSIFFAVMRGEEIDKFLSSIYSVLMLQLTGCTFSMTRKIFFERLFDFVHTTFFDDGKPYRTDIISIIISYIIFFSFLCCFFKRFIHIIFSAFLTSSLGILWFIFLSRLNGVVTTYLKLDLSSIVGKLQIIFYDMFFVFSILCANKWEVNVSTVIIFYASKLVVRFVLYFMLKLFEGDIHPWNDMKNICIWILLVTCVGGTAIYVSSDKFCKGDGHKRDILDHFLFNEFSIELLIILRHRFKKNNSDEAIFILLLFSVFFLSWNMLRSIDTRSLAKFVESILLSIHITTTTPRREEFTTGREIN